MTGTPPRWGEAPALPGYPWDLVGYGSHPPNPHWPGGARIAVSFVLNVEEGGENSVLHGDPGSETFLSEIVNAQPFTDRHLSMESLYEYGSRAGVWRVLRLFASRGLPLTVFAVARALQAQPELTDALVAAGHEIAGHGLRWISYQDIDVDTERAHLAEAVRILTDLIGSPPLGWYTGRDSPNTRRLVIEHGGFLYDSDSYADDLPSWVTAGGHSHLVIPYTLDTNDMRFVTPQGFNTGDHFFAYCRDAFDVLYAEGATTPKMLSIGLHARIVGRPARFAALERLVDYLLARDGVWITRRVDIARHWIGNSRPVTSMIEPFDPPARLLMGPGPINADPRVLRAMSASLIGQFDPAMTGAMNQAMALYRQVFRTTNPATFLVDGTARAGIEAILVSLIEPGDRVLVPVFGRFGYLLTEIASCCGADVHTLEVPWGSVFPLDQLEEAIERVEPVVVATVHGDTSTTMCQPIEGLGAFCRRHGAVFYTDVTASIGGNRFEMDRWGIDAASAGLQKCLAGPSGSAPVSLSPSAVGRVTARKRVEAGIRDASDDDDLLRTATTIRSNYFDVAMLLDYWGERRLNHHTEATSMLYAALECARILVAEGVDAAIERHRRHGAAMTAGVEGLGLKVFGDVAHKMHNVVGVGIPEGVDGEAVRNDLLHHFGIEIGTSFGPLRGKIWRIGTMGYNARTDAVLVTLAALEHTLRRHGAPVAPGGGVDAALRSYEV